MKRDTGSMVVRGRNVCYMIRSRKLRATLMVAEARRRPCVLLDPGADVRFVSGTFLRLTLMLRLFQGKYTRVVDRLAHFYHVCP